MGAAATGRALSGAAATGRALCGAVATGKALSASCARKLAEGESGIGWFILEAIGKELEVLASPLAADSAVSLAPVGLL